MSSRILRGMTSCRLRLVGTACLRWCLLVLPAGVLGAVTPPAQAQVAQRVVSGKVLDKGGAAVRNAVVYLKDDRTSAVKSYISDDSGGYRFGQLAQGTDYELWAEADGKKSGTKMVSSFESKNNITVNLKLDK